MSEQNVWKSFFQNWPADVERTGLLVAAFSEQIGFSNFAVGDELIILERKVPDSYGARKIVLPYAMIQAVKFIEVVKLRSFAPLGFEEPKAKKP